MCNVAVIFLALCASALSATDVNKALWKSTAIDVSSITARAHAEVTAKSEILCAARTGQQINSSLYCSAGDRCVVSLTTERGPTDSTNPDPMTCKCLERICPDGFEFVACNGCFHFSTNEALFDDAKTECQNMGASLASLSALSEYEAIRQYIMQEGSGVKRFLVDIRRLDATAFVWGDGALLPPVTGAKPWAPNEPANAAGESCAIMDKPNNYRLADINCASSYSYICRM